MTQPRKEQINIRRAYWTVFTYTATGGTTSTVIAAATLQPSTITQIPGGDPTTSPPTRGIITTGTGGFVRLRKVDSALSLDDVGAQIYGRLTFSAGNYTITYKKISGGVEVSATLPSAGPYSVEMLLPEVMDFAEIPANADIIYGSFQELLPSGNTIAGDLVVAGNTTLGDATSDTITLNARFISDLIPTPDNTRSLGSSSLRWADGHFTQISLRADNTNTVKSIYNSAGITATGTAFTIDGNSSLNFGTSTTTGITIGRVGVTTVINGSLNPTGAVTVGGVLTVNGSPSVFNGDVNITGTLTVGNISFVDLTVSGNTILGDDATVDSVDFGSRVISSFVPKFSDSYDLGQTDLRWRALHSTRVVAHADDADSIYAVLDSDSLFSTVPFDMDGYGTLFIGTTWASDIQIGHSSINPTLNGSNIYINSTVIRGLDSSGLEIDSAFAPTESIGPPLTLRAASGGMSIGSLPGGTGGAAYMLGGAGGNGFPFASLDGGQGGSANVSAGLGGDGTNVSAPGTGGTVGILAGAGGTWAGFGNARGGDVLLQAGDGYVENDAGGGQIYIIGGASTQDNSGGGGVQIRGGNAFFGLGGAGGPITIASGDGASDSVAGNVTISTGVSSVGNSQVVISCGTDGDSIRITAGTTGPVSIEGSVLFIYANTNWQGSTYPDLPNSGGVAFAINSTPVGPTVLAPALDTLTNGSDATGLHTHLGSGSYTVTATQTGTFSATYGDLVACDPSGGGFTVNLPTAVANPNKSIIIKNVTNSTNAITIAAFGFESIDGMGTQTISIGYQALTLYSDGAGWMII